jgi:hypothetical protein
LGFSAIQIRLAGTQIISKLHCLGAELFGRGISFAGNFS